MWPGLQRGSDGCTQPPAKLFEKQTVFIFFFMKSGFADGCVLCIKPRKGSDCTSEVAHWTFEVSVFFLH